MKINEFEDAVAWLAVKNIDEKIREAYDVSSNVTNPNAAKMRYRTVSFHVSDPQEGDQATILVTIDVIRE